MALPAQHEVAIYYMIAARISSENDTWSRLIKAMKTPIQQ